jgi:hypothetical protein
MSISFAAAGRPRVGAYDEWELEPNYPPDEDGSQVKYVDQEYRTLSDLLNSKRTTVRANKFDAAVRHYEKWYNQETQKFAVGPIKGYTFDYGKEAKEFKHFFGGKDAGDSFLEKYKDLIGPQVMASPKKVDYEHEVFLAAPAVDVANMAPQKALPADPVVPAAAPSKAAQPDDGKEEEEEDESDSDDDEEESSDDEDDAPKHTSKNEALQSILKDMKKLVDQLENALK